MPSREPRRARLSAYPHQEEGETDALHNLYRSPADFVFTVTRDFVRSCRTPMLVLPDDIPAHPLAISMEIVSLAPNAEASIFPWKESTETIRKVVEHARTFLQAHEPIASR